MPNLTGFFAQFKDLDQIPLADISRWLKLNISEDSLVNFIANRILYPQTVSVTKEDIEIDLAIFREIIKHHPNKFYDDISRKLTISSELLNRFTPPPKLITAILDSISLKEGVFQMVLNDENNSKVFGSILILNSADSLFNLQSIIVNNTKINLKLNKINFLLFKDNHLEIKTKAKDYLASGGDLGLIVIIKNS